MKISLNWLRDFLEIPANVNTQELGDLITLRTAEVEHVENLAQQLENIVIGRIETIKKHPDADKLSITETNIGDETVQIICGGTNLRKGMMVAVAKPGAKVRWHGEGDLITLEKTKIRGMESCGMICAGEEIGVNQPPGGGERAILDLSHLNDAVPGTSLSEALGLNDTIFTIDNKSLTHRPDLWGHYGIAREIAAISGQKLKPYQPKVEIPASGETINVKIKDTTLCPRFSALIINNVKIAESPNWLKERLLAIGHGTHNNMVDITNYVMCEFGQPMHAFDKEKIKNGLTVRQAQKNEKITTLDGKTHQLPKDAGVVADDEKAVSIAGIIGGANSEIDASTTSIILEAANWHPSMLRRTSAALGIRTDALQRFEKSLDPRNTETAILRAAELILQVCPEAQIAGPLTDIKNFKDQATTVTVDLQKVRSKIGVDVPTDKAVKILESLEFKILTNKNDQLEIEIPSFRATKDIEMEDDITEEIARMYGYENIEPKLPQLPTKLPKENTERKLKHFARQILSYGLGFDEIYNYSFYSLKDIQKCLIPEELHIKVANYLSEDQTHMRVSLIPNMLKNVVLNLKNSPSFSFYEIGRTYENLTDYFPVEEKKICGMVVQPKTKKSGTDSGASATSTATTATPFYAAKAALEELLSHFNVGLLDMQRGEAICWYAHPNRYADYFAPHYEPENNNEIARVFELHPLVLKNYDLENTQVAAFEINFTKLARLGRAKTHYSPIPKFPGIEFDVAVLVPHELPIGRLQAAIYATDPELIQNVTLFDIYQGSNIAPHQKSCAFNIQLQAPDRTLKDEEMKHLQTKIFKELETLGGEIRRAQN